MDIYCTNKAFCDFDEFIESVKNWDGQFRQLNSGRFSSELVQYINSDIQFLHSRVNQHVEQIGVSPKELVTISIPAAPHIRINWYGVNVPPDSVLIIQPKWGIDCVTWDDWDIYNISISHEQLSQLCSELGYPSLYETIVQSEVIRCNPNSLAGLREMCAILSNRLKSFSQDIGSWVYEKIRFTIPTMLMHVLASDQVTMINRPLRKRDKAIKEIKGYLDTVSDTSPKIYDLCKMFNVTDRTLEYGFRENYGVTPKQYLKAYRLNQVNKALRQKRRQADKIADIANRFGFWHMGQFAADYRKLFGELPSETFIRHSFSP